MSRGWPKVGQPGTYPGTRKSKVDTLPGTKKSENFKTEYLTKNRELNREVQAWTSWVHQEVIGYTGKLLCF